MGVTVPQLHDDTEGSRAESALACKGCTTQVLLLDGDARSTNRLAQMLAEDGYGAEAFADGDAALQRLADGPLPDVLVTDLHVLQGSGNAVIREFRARNPSAPVIVVTARPHLMKKSEPPPMLLTKPVRYEELRAFIHLATSANETKSE